MVAGIHLNVILFYQSIIRDLLFQNLSLDVICHFMGFLISMVTYTNIQNKIQFWPILESIKHKFEQPSLEEMSKCKELYVL
jgi:hypothetical protein